ncbi:MAG TPA: radical SAM protein, partial [Tepidisphaeraceae bacterium]|nr:radical SAM protein [Tepidisphaeraceae bacterium]
MADIVLSTLNARYIHASFGLRYLRANLGELFDCSTIVEFDINQSPMEIVESLVAHDPKIVGLGVYIWNAEQSNTIAALLKKIRPEIILVLGGPEVSYETEQQAITQIADFVITGEADLAFADLCRQLLTGRRPLTKIIAADLPDFSQLRLPYDLYDAEDVAHRVVYVEASRGCPFKCEFCLSSLDVPVRNVPLDGFLAEMQKLLDRGLRQFKFVDRTFNLNLNTSKGILQFFLDRYTEGLFLHFEMIPDRLPEGLREWIERFPAGALQFEIGVQTFNEQVSQRISRKQDNARLEDNMRFLRTSTGVHIHTDLIVGLPGETLESFAAGFDRLVRLEPQEIQVGILKRLRGTPIIRHDDEFKMVYSPHPPYEIMQNSTIDFVTMQRLRRFSRYWDLIANSGNFRSTLPMIWGKDSPFASFLHLSDWLWKTAHRSGGISLQHICELLFTFLTVEMHRPEREIALAIWTDYKSAGRSDRLKCLLPYIADLPIPRRRANSSAAPSRQRRHL